MVLILMVLSSGVATLQILHLPGNLPLIAPHLPFLLSPRAMTADDYDPEWDDYDPAFLAFIARLDLSDTGTPQPPRTPSPAPQTSRISHRAMAADDYNPEWDDSDPALLAFIARLGLSDIGTPQPPRTPSPTPESHPVQLHTFPSMNSRHYESNTPNPTVYQFESPTRHGYTPHWCACLLFFLYPAHSINICLP
jgi:hypothetical protein